VGILPTDLVVAPQRDETGVSALVTTEFGQADRLERVDPPAAAEAPVGYFDAVGGLSARITQGALGARMSLASSLGSTLYNLEALGPDLWRGVSDTPMPLALTLEVDEAGFALTSGRTIRLRFERRR
jgi:hypothetical protein